MWNVNKTGIEEPTFLSINCENNCISSSHFRGGITSGFSAKSRKIANMKIKIYQLHKCVGENWLNFKAFRFAQTSKVKIIIWTIFVLLIQLFLWYQVITTFDFLKSVDLRVGGRGRCNRRKATSLPTFDLKIKRLKTYLRLDYLREIYSVLYRYKMHVCMSKTKYFQFGTSIVFPWSSVVQKSVVAISSCCISKSVLKKLMQHIPTINILYILYHVCVNFFCSHRSINN